MLLRDINQLKNQSSAAAAWGNCPTIIVVLITKRILIASVVNFSYW
jgi:hypothetical protein